MSTSNGFLFKNCYSQCSIFNNNQQGSSCQQMDVWATGSIDLAAWNKSFLAHTSFVAVDGETIAEFGDIDSSGYLDRLYVHKDHQGIGIATALYAKNWKHLWKVRQLPHMPSSLQDHFSRTVDML